jgi:N-acetylmuramoyl-L-alanine amidase
MKAVISSGHGKHIRGAKGLIDEVDEARRVVASVADCLKDLGVDVVTFHDDISTTQAANLRRIIDYHNAQERDLDVSIHFNAHKRTDKPVGAEVCYSTQSTKALATSITKAIAKAAHLVDRRAKHRPKLAFLNRTTKPAVLLEVCFVDSKADVAAYREHLKDICHAIADAIEAKDKAAAS